MFTFSLVVVLNKEAYDLADVDDTVALTTTNKGKPPLHGNGYVYRLDRTYAKSKTWRCTKNGCKARCRTDQEHSNVQFTNEHCDHETQSDRDMTVKEFRRNCKRRGADDLFQKPSKNHATGATEHECSSGDRGHRKSPFFVVMESRRENNAEVT